MLARPDPATVAVIATSQGLFEDWETVYVQHRWAESTPIFPARRRADRQGDDLLRHEVVGRRP
jgi:hypothetical protein